MTQTIAQYMNNIGYNTVKIVAGAYEIRIVRDSTNTIMTQHNLANGQWSTVPDASLIDFGLHLTQKNIEKVVITDPTNDRGICEMHGPVTICFA